MAEKNSHILSGKRKTMFLWRKDGGKSSSTKYCRQKGSSQFVRDEMNMEHLLTCPPSFPGEDMSDATFPRALSPVRVCCKCQWGLVPGWYRLHISNQTGVSDIFYKDSDGLSKKMELHIELQDYYGERVTSHGTIELECCLKLKNSGQIIHEDTPLNNGKKGKDILSVGPNLVLTDGFATIPYRIEECSKNCDLFFVVVQAKKQLNCGITNSCECHISEIQTVKATEVRSKRPRPRSPQKGGMEVIALVEKKLKQMKKVHASDSPRTVALELNSFMSAHLSDYCANSKDWTSKINVPLTSDERAAV